MSARGFASMVGALGAAALMFAVMFVTTLSASAIRSSGGPGLTSSSGGPGLQTRPTSPQSPTRDVPASSLRLGSASVSGVVVAENQERRPVRRVVVRLAGADGTSVAAITDDDGRFRVDGLRAGRYTITASKAGYVTSSYGATRPGRPGTAIVVADGQRIENLSLTILPGAVITGTIHDETGEPAIDGRVALLRLYGSGAARRWSLASLGSEIIADEHGTFRIFGLPPGEYLLLASAAPRSSEARQMTDAEYQRARQVLFSGATAAVARPAASASSEAPPVLVSVPVYYPGTLSEDDAQPIAIGVGEERSGINFTVRRVRTGRISGTIVDADGRPAAGVMLTLPGSSRAPGLALERINEATADAEGRFVFTHVPPGRHTIVARTAAPFWALAEVTTSGDDVSVAMALRRGLDVAGTIVSDTTEGASRPDLSRVRLRLEAVLSAGQSTVVAAPATPAADGTFSLSGVAPGRYRVEVTVPSAGRGVPATWFVKTVKLAGRDVLDVPIEIDAADVSGLVVTLTNRPTEVTGVLQDTAGNPAPDYFLIVFPRDPARWKQASPRIQQVRPGADGRYQFRGLPPGEYLLGAVTDVQPGEQFERAFLERLAVASIPLVLAEGERKVQDIRVR